LSERPLLVGVGISTPEQAEQAAAFSDGVIVGSALVRRLVEGDLQGALDAARAFRAVL
jgi:tryptophan synthase alpha chain